jgi:aryl-alcohol dehydrogenase-like predicted oxidoreductase
MGRAEGLLGEFLQGRRDQVTVTTKFGITPPAAARRLGFLVPMAKAALRYFPVLDRGLRGRAANATTSSDFSPDAARRSLEVSLRALRTDYIDILLLHEASVLEAGDADLLGLLEEWKRAGTIRSYGIGSEYSKLGGDCAPLSAGHRVLQFENSAACPNRADLRNVGDRLVITHSAFKEASLCARLLALHRDRAEHFRRDTGFDVLDSRELHRLLLAWALHDDPDGLVLFGSKRRENVRSNAAVVDDPRLDPETARAFGALIQGLVLPIRGDSPFPSAR